MDFVDERFYGGPVLPEAAQYGFVGVVLFFVLCGFVMVHLTRMAAGSPKAIPAFLSARAARIYPLWWLCLGAVSLVWLARPDRVFATLVGVAKLPADFALLPPAAGPVGHGAAAPAGLSG